MRYLFLMGCFLTFTQTAKAQLKPSQVYLFEVRQTSDSTFAFTKPRYLTAFNPNGYNNHPAFFSNSELYISSQLPSESQPELLAMDIDNQTLTRITDTPEGEYSPFRMPDYYNFSAVRMEINGRDTLQRLWQFPLDRLSNGKPVFKYYTKIGYYQWLNSRQVILFIVDSPNQLVVADVDYDRLTPIATNVGRCFRMMPDGTLAYVVKDSQGNAKIVKKRPTDEAARAQDLIITLQGSEDFAILPDGALIMGQGSRLYKYHPNRDKDWVQIADLRLYNIREITRIAIGPGYETFRLALVGSN